MRDRTANELVNVWECLNMRDNGGGGGGGLVVSVVVAAVVNTFIG